MQAAEEKRQPVVEPQSALPALLALCISSVLPRRQHRRRRECHWGAGENIGTEEVFRPRVATCATNKVDGRVGRVRADMVSDAVHIASIRY